MDNKENFLKKIELKKEALKIASENLKKKFVGLDAIIDKLIDSISVWYMMPELQTRPLIVCLWGLTGVGKTDLVRNLVAELEVRDKFVEVQLDNTANSGDRIQHFLDRTSIEPEDQSILLLDEVQRFRTVDSKANEIDSSAFKDVWMLLSDGRFQSNSEKKMDLMRMLLQDLYWEDAGEEELKESEDTPDKKKKRKRKYSFGYWIASDLKRLTKTKASLEDIMKWDQQRKTEEIMAALKDDSTFEGSKYSKLLVIISGNLDEAYRMSTDVDDADVDADIFHEFSKRINLVSIKNALLARFKPEQIARFGNNHIIYPSLSKDSYEKIIKMNIHKFTDSIKQNYNIDIDVDETVYDTIYKNGVFPAQGVRPVLSTISSTFENYLPYFVFEAIKNNLSKFKVCFDGDLIKTDIDNKLNFKVQLSLDNIKKKKSLDENTLVAVHEAGHAIAYGVLFGCSPSQIKTLTSANDREGFVGLHMRLQSKQMVLNEIATNLAGRAAEEIVFGDYLKSVGAGGDITAATKAAAHYVRHVGFDGSISHITTTSDSLSPYLNTDMEKTNPVVEELLEDGKKRAVDILNSNKAFFKALVNELLDKKELLPEEFSELGKKFGHDIKVENVDVTLTESYSNLWSSYEKEIKEKE
jgi:hypothetical protein